MLHAWHGRVGRETASAQVRDAGKENVKKVFGNRTRINKGAPSGLVASLVFHLAAFFIAGLFVVFTVVTKQEPEFEPPPPIEYVPPLPRW